MLKERLDREDREFYSLTLVAVDGGRPPKSVSTTVNIRVIDTNDNQPRFELAPGQNHFEAEISENAPIGTSIIQVSLPERKANTFKSF